MVLKNVYIWEILMQKEIGVTPKIMYTCNGLCFNKKKPQDYVIATGQMTSVREFIELSAIEIGWNKVKGGKGIIWEKDGIDEIGKRADTGEIVVRIDPRYFRPTEVEQLKGDASKARKELNWMSKISLEALISEMIKEDSLEAKKEFLLKNKGFSVYSPNE